MFPFAKTILIGRQGSSSLSLSTADFLIKVFRYLGRRSKNVRLRTSTFESERSYKDASICIFLIEIERKFTEIFQFGAKRMSCNKFGTK